LVRRGQRNSLPQGIWQRNFFRIAGRRHDPRRIGAAVSKACDKFPAPEGQGIIRPSQGNVSTPAGNSQGRARNRRQHCNPDANVACRSFFGRSFVDGANFDGKIDRIRSWLYKLRLPARFARGFFAPTSVAARPSFRLIRSGRVNPHPACFRVDCASETFPAFALNLIKDTPDETPDHRTDDDRAPAAVCGQCRTHSKKQVRQIADSIARFGFTNPILIDDDDKILPGMAAWRPPSTWA
jgi:hypothetical protein